jgi:ketosteroid isomerase-like protein
MIGALMARRAIRSAFEALDRHDLSTFMSGWRDDGVFVYPGAIPESGSFEGKSVVENWFRNFLDQFPAIHFDIRDICIKNIFALSGTNVISVHWDIHLTNRSGREGENSGVTVIEIVGGKVFRVKDFIFDLGENFELNWAH